MRDSKIVVTVTTFMLKMSLRLRETSSPTLNIPATNDRSYKIMFETLSCDIFIFAVLLSAFCSGSGSFDYALVNLN